MMVKDHSQANDEQLHALRLADHRHERLLARAGEEIVEADAEDELDPQQRRQRREEATPFELREQLTLDRPAALL